MKEAGVVWIRTLILCRQNTVAQFIATRPILGLREVTERRPGTQVPRRWWEQTGIDWKAAMEAAAAKNGDDEAVAEEPELMGSESEPETATPGGTAGGPGRRSPWEPAAPVEQSGAGKKIDLSGRDPKKYYQSSYFKSIKGKSLEFNIAAALGLEIHHPIMSKLWGLGDQTYRQTHRHKTSRQINKLQGQKSHIENYPRG